MKSNLNIEQALIIGATGAIGKSFVDYLQQNLPYAQIFTDFRQKQPLPQTQSHFLDATKEESWRDFAQYLKTHTQKLDLIIFAQGFLHDESISPEKSVRDIHADVFFQTFAINTLATALGMKYLEEFIDRKRPSLVSFISAKVGSISDNRLGGWYSYRSSKAALNMLIKNFSIELKRKRKPCLVLSLHPGTTYSELSRPFTDNVNYHIKMPDETASQLMYVMRTTNHPSGSFLNWDGDILPW